MMAACIDILLVILLFLDLLSALGVEPTAALEWSVRILLPILAWIAGGFFGEPGKKLWHRFERTVLKPRLPSSERPSKAVREAAELREVVRNLERQLGHSEGRLKATESILRQQLELERHPTCGFVAETYRSTLEILAGALPDAYEGERPYGSTLYFLVTPDAQIVMHRIRSDQLYHHYVGDPLEVLMLYPDGGGAVATVGSDLAADMRPQLFIPGGTFHVSYLAPGGIGWALLASTEWPGVEPPTSNTGTSPPS